MTTHASTGRIAQVRLRYTFIVVSLVFYGVDSTRAGDTMPGQESSDTKITQATNSDTKEEEAKRLYAVKFSGPIEGAWLAELTKFGQVTLLNSLPGNAYLVWAKPEAIDHVNQFRSEAGPIISVRPLDEKDRLDARLQRKAVEPALASEETIQVSVQFVDHAGIDGQDGSIQKVKTKAKRVLRDMSALGNLKQVQVSISSLDLSYIAGLRDVVSVELLLEPQLFDERQDQILAEMFDSSGLRISPPQYLGWLGKLGFDESFDFTVNVSDSGIHNGDIREQYVHPDFLDPSKRSRVGYVQRVEGDQVSVSLRQNNDDDGHGTHVASIIGGLPNSVVVRDSRHFALGLGVAPFVLLGSSKVFPWNSPDHTVVTSEAYRNGARISNNSWGVISDGYDVVSREFDFLVRDASPETRNFAGLKGNQGMIIVFAVGNAGVKTDGRPQTLGGMGSTAKNTIAVGSSYNRAVDANEKVDVNEADYSSIATGSSRGPTKDRRFKPDLVAPGTCVYGVRSEDRSRKENCLDGGQRQYIVASGTSYAAPAVSGAAALIRQLLRYNCVSEPSPALVKAWLMNSTKYLEGAGGNDDLPSNNQGMGRLSLNRALSKVSRIIVDQTAIFNTKGQIHEIKGQIDNASEPFRVTLAWTDAPSLSLPRSDSLDEPTLVNDLDLEVLIGEGQSQKLYLGNVFRRDESQAGGSSDKRNNVESVWLKGFTGSFTVRVRASKISGDGIPGEGDILDQDYGLVIYNAKKSSGALGEGFPGGEWNSCKEKK